MQYLSLVYGGHDTVSLFTREWIEILPRYVTVGISCGLPLYEGVD